MENGVNVLNEGGLVMTWKPKITIGIISINRYCYNWSPFG